MLNRPNAFRRLGLLGLYCIGVGLFLVHSTTAQHPAQRSAASLKLEAETKKNKEKVAKIGNGHDITIHRRGGEDLAGTIVEIKDESVVVREVDLKANVEIPYQQIKSVEKGYTDSPGITGQRIPPKKHRLGLIIVGAGAAVLAVMLIVTLRNPNF